MEDKIIENKELNIWEALLPIIVLVCLLAWNVYVYGDDALSGSNQFILLIGAAVAAIVGFMNKVSYTAMINEVADNLKSTTNALLILLLVGSLAGTWMLSGIIPTLIYGGLKILSPGIFLPASVVICAVISLATGSSWTTSATVGIALIGIAKAIGISPGMAAGAVLSGAYFGDKMSPLSDTTNLAASMSGAELFSHIRYMSLTTIPTITVTLILFILISFGIETTGGTDTAQLLTDIKAAYNVNIFLMIVPLVVIGLIMKKTKPLIALLIGSLLGGVFALIFQPDVVATIGGSDSLTFVSGYRGVMDALTVSTVVESSNPILSELFSTGGMSGMMGTIWLIICDLVFGGIMDAIGALQRISAALLSMAKSTFGLFASTVASCLAINVTASDQYLAIVVPGKMFDTAYREKGLAPENLSRTLEDSGTVTSVLIPWNTCGAYHSGVLGVSVFDYFVYTFFSYISPFMTLIFAALGIKIKQLIK